MAERKGLSGQHHGELNRPVEVFEGGADAKAQRIALLREEYADDSKALQQIDVYEGSNEYSEKLTAFVGTLKSGNTGLQRRLTKWFRTHYPDITK